MYCELLEELALPAAAREQMIKTQDIEKKWAMIEAQSTCLLQNEHGENARQQHHLV